eukprot:COSAG02_NODE_3215_length_7161_cov_57.637638_2_plen_78_part_00
MPGATVIDAAVPYGPDGLTPIPSVMDMAALDARDQEALNYKPRISTDVRRYEDRSDFFISRQGMFLIGKLSQSFCCL